MAGVAGLGPLTMREVVQWNWATLTLGHRFGDEEYESRRYTISWAVTQWALFHG